MTASKGQTEPDDRISMGMPIPEMMEKFLKFIRRLTTSMTLGLNPAPTPELHRSINPPRTVTWGILPKITVTYNRLASIWTSHFGTP
ncbi:hypothetical protein PAXRUDRAFT_830699 [Paxillus rubicundulus Ve08.2h10]|uniref:Uncharacterized protein n=1 Tax=Paxillus rubicundulus Ve08.2h10 TaxID=930991 RepID=A0A0D0DK97_9AGAM|nr:hypothetical protein PAXRUDRAFT_830699 [Paxillus rubicundulus Ve08.2h10]